MKAPAENGRANWRFAVIHSVRSLRKQSKPPLMVRSFFEEFIELQPLAAAARRGTKFSNCPENERTISANLLYHGSAIFTVPGRGAAT
jgi:hypothetical protein